jgi:uncharacterized membrane protein YvlD (DUF360 family)
MSGLKDRTKADIAKLHSEINQFRNQEFVVCSFAIALFGATAKELPGKWLLSLSVLVLLVGLFLWHYTLVSTRSRLASYLRVRRLSQWEDNYTNFASKLKSPSQRKAALVIFITLGLLTFVIAASEYIQNCFDERTISLDDQRFWHYVPPIVAYMAIVSRIGLRSWEEKIALYEQIWRDVLGKDLEAEAALDV